MWIIKHEDGQEIAAVEDSSISDWWRINEDKYFGLRVEGGYIIVCNTPQTKQTHKAINTHSAR